MTDPLLAVSEFTPILFSDTCTILDLLRDPTREFVTPIGRRAALGILDEIENGTLVSFIAPQVLAEFTSSLPSVRDETERAIRSLQETVIRVSDVVRVYKAGDQITLSLLDDHASVAQQVADRWVAASRVLAEDTQVRLNALERSLASRTPAQLGKSSTADCVIIETYLSAARKLKETGHRAPIAFVSSNVKDYAGSDRNKLKPDLAAEFNGVPMEFASSLSPAMRLLNLKRLSDV